MQDSEWHLVPWALTTSHLKVSKYLKQYVTKPARFFSTREAKKVHVTIWLWSRNIFRLQSVLGKSRFENATDSESAELYSWYAHPGQSRGIQKRKGSNASDMSLFYSIQNLRLFHAYHSRMLSCLKFEAPELFLRNVDTMLRYGNYRMPNSSEQLFSAKLSGGPLIAPRIPASEDAVEDVIRVIPL